MPPQSAFVTPGLPSVLRSLSAQRVILGFRMFPSEGLGDRSQVAGVESHGRGNTRRLVYAGCGRKTFSYVYFGKSRTRRVVSDLEIASRLRARRGENV